MMRISVKTDFTQELDPVIIRGPVNAWRTLNRCTRGIVACKVGRIDVESSNDSRNCQLHHTPVKASTASTSRFPAVHILTVCIKSSFVEFRFRIRQQPLLVCKKIIATVNGDCAEFFTREIDCILSELREV